MESLMRVRGIELRYLPTWLVCHDGPCGVAELVDRLEQYGFEPGGRASKTVSDALRWEVRRGRLLRLERDWYMIGDIPRATEYRIHQRVIQLRVRARLSRRGGHADTRLCGGRRCHGQAPQRHTSTQRHLEFFCQAVDPGLDSGDRR